MCGVEVPWSALLCACQLRVPAGRHELVRARTLLKTADRAWSERLFGVAAFQLLVVVCICDGTSCVSVLT